MATKIETTAAQTTADIAGFTTVQLRKIAASEYGIKGMSSARKSDLLAAIYAAQVKRETAEIADYAREFQQAKIDAEQVEADAKEIERLAALEAEQDAKPAKPAKPVRKSTKCQVCGAKKIDKKTQGRDSTMCTDCYDYAGWENTHTDEAHEEVGADPECPVCEKVAPINPTNVDPTEIENPKAARFAADAVAAGWKVASATVAGEATTLTVLGGAGTWIQICWNGKVFSYDETSHKTDDGKVRKIRNASAARMILAS